MPAFVVGGIRSERGRSRAPSAAAAPRSSRASGRWSGEGEPESPRQARLHEAFLKTGKSYAKDVWATTSRALTNYARAWADMHKQTCEATAVRKEQSNDTLDLRMSCLNERLGGLRALTDVFADANGEVVENAVSASNALASLDRCADVPLLRAVVKPPEDAATRAKVEQLRKQLAELKARFDAGRWKEAVRDAPRLTAGARAEGYEPLTAEALAILGTILYKSDDAKGARGCLHRVLPARGLFAARRGSRGKRRQPRLRHWISTRSIRGGAAMGKGRCRCVAATGRP